MVTTGRCVSWLCSIWILLIPAADGDDGIDFPPKLDSDDVAFFFENNDLDGLHWALTNVFQRSERNPEALNSDSGVKLPDTLVARGGGTTYTTAYKLEADIEQARYLAENLVDEGKAQFFGNVVLPAYEWVLANIPPLDELQRTDGLYPFNKDDIGSSNIMRFYNRALHLTEIDDKSPDGNPVPILNENLDVGSIQRQWFGEGNDLNSNNVPGVVVIDDLLSTEALGLIRKVMLESTVWYQTKKPLKFGGYVGAYIDDGLHDRILLKLAFELHRALPRIMKDHPLKYLWAYKYDSEFTGINLHADQAAVNVNIWLTPDDANLDPESGGLVVFTAKPPGDWDFDKYNTDTNFVMEELLKPTNYANVTIPHKQNRAVMFDSALFHQTDKYKFKPGHKNKRINLTLLYGNMQMSSAGGQKGSDSSTDQEL